MVTVFFAVFISLFVGFKIGRFYEREYNWGKSINNFYLAKDLRGWEEYEVYRANDFIDKTQREFEKIIIKNLPFAHKAQEQGWFFVEYALAVDKKAKVPTVLVCVPSCYSHERDLVTYFRVSELKNPDERAHIAAVRLDDYFYRHSKYIPTTPK